MSLTSGLMGEAVSSILGNPKKALLILFTGDENPVFDSQTVAKAAENALSGGLANTAANVASGLQANLAQSAMAGGLSGAAAAAQVTQYHVLEVQYNPSSISLQANADSIPIQYLQQNLDSGIPTQLQRPPSVVLSVELVFDAMNIFDSFMWDKFTSGVSAQSITNIATAVSKDKGKVWSVKKQTNGLLAALMRDSTRTVIFKWADMTFSGELTEAQARYTMFSPTGRPVRSVVRLNITQQVKSTADIQYWDKAMDQLIANSSTTASQSGAASVKSSLGGLINIGF